MDKINTFTHKITAWLIIFISFIGVLNAILRYVGRYLHLNLSSNIFIELQWYSFSIAFLLGASYAFIKDKHIRVDVLYNKFSKKTKRITNVFGNLLLLLPLCLLMLYVSLEYFYTSFEMSEQSPDTGGLPRYIIKFFIPLSFLYLAINVACKTLKK